MPAQIDTFQPEKRTVGVLLSSTSPPIRVPDYQRDYSWEHEQVSEFWEDLTAFAGAPSSFALTGKEYFLGAAVLVNNGTYHLLLDGQQRLATATILLAAIRDKMRSFNTNAAEQIQSNYITFEDYITGGRVFKIELNLFDRSFFRDYIQSYPRVVTTTAAKKSHQLIQYAYEFFSQKLDEVWASAGSGKNGFEWVGHLSIALREHMSLVTVTSTNEKSAASIFSTLNDRGIGLSTVDLIRSYVLQQTHPTKREETIQCWDAMFDSCGTNFAAESLIRMSWVAQYGDVKTRALYKIVSDDVPENTSPLDYSRRLRDDAALYRNFREGDVEDDETEEYWLALRTLRFNAGYSLLIAAEHGLKSAEERKNIAKALVALVIRYNIVSNLDRAKIESTVYSAAKALSDALGFEAALVLLLSISPSEAVFNNGFETLAFSSSNIGVARYLLRCFNNDLAATEEVSVGGPDKVHVEHIYPQNPPPDRRWKNHARMVGRIGNLTLLDKGLNTYIKNADFPTKKEKAYKTSKLEITQELLEFTDWDEGLVIKRQQTFAALAEKIWPQGLLD
jgi:hypothetical protein